MNKKQKTDECRRILNKYNAGERITDVNESLFLISIFENHTNFIDKKGVGIDYFSVEKTPYNTNCFVINRVDGTSTDISFMHSITKRSDMIKLKMACRNSIKNTVIKYRYDNVVYGVSKCAISGEILTEGNVHIDHYNDTFDGVFNRWIKELNIKELVSKLNKTQDNNFETHFTDIDVVNNFIIFHDANTHLRAVTKQINLSLLKKGLSL